MSTTVIILAAIDIDSCNFLVGEWPNEGGRRDMDANSKARNEIITLS